MAEVEPLTEFNRVCRVCGRALVEPLTYTVPQAAAALNVSADHLRHLIRDGIIATVPGMGKRTLISRAWLARWVETASVAAEAGTHRPSAA